MYSLQLMDGTILKNLKRINPSTFELSSNDGSIYYLLSDDNLSLAFLNEEDFPVDIFEDYTLQNFSCFGDGIIRFRIGPWEETHKVSNRDKKNLKKFKRGQGK